MTSRPFHIEPLANEPLRGILLIIAAFVTFSMLDTTAKHLVQHYPPAQVVWVRYAGHLVIAAVIFLPRHGLGLLHSQRLGLQVVRSLLLFGATCANFAALQFLQLAETSSILFSTPLMVAVLAIPLLGEHIGPRRWAAIAIGFIGVVIVIRPGLGLVHWAAGLSLLCALFVRHFRHLIAAGHVHVAMPPLYRIDVGKDVFYALDDAEKQGILDRIAAEKRRGKVSVQRFKGLGEMNPLQLRETTMASETRRLLQLTLDPGDDTNDLMDMLLSKKRAADRKAWLQRRGDLAEVS